MSSLFDSVLGSLEDLPRCLSILSRMGEDPSEHAQIVRLVADDSLPLAVRTLADGCLPFTAKREFQLVVAKKLLSATDANQQWLGVRRSAVAGLRELVGEIRLLILSPGQVGWFSSTPLSDLARSAVETLEEGGADPDFGASVF